MNAHFIHRTNFTLRLQDPAMKNTSAIDLTKELGLYCPIPVGRDNKCGGGGIFSGFSCSDFSVDLTASLSKNHPSKRASTWPVGC